MFFIILCVFLNLFSKDIEYSFKDLKILSSDITIEGSNPEFEFFIPSYKNLRELKLQIKLKTIVLSNNSCKIILFVNDTPFKTYSCRESDVLEFSLTSFNKSDFVKFKVRAFSENKNPCDISNKIYLTVLSDSKVLISFNDINSFEYFTKNYLNSICITQKELIPLAYYLNLNSKIPHRFNWGSTKECRDVSLSTYNLITSSYVVIDQNYLKTISRNYASLSFSSSPVFYEVYDNIQCRDKENFIMFSDLGFGNKTIDFLIDGSIRFNFDTSRIGYIPKKLNLILNVEHTSNFEERSEIRLNLNGIFVGSYPLKGFGKRRFNFSVPSNLINWGQNLFEVKLLSSMDLKYCSGSMFEKSLTIFSNSYFYWSGIYSKAPDNISDFFRGLNGKLALSIDDDNLSAFILSLLSQLPYINSNIKEIVVEKDPKDYDFLISVKKQKPGPFEIYNPLTKEVLFRADYSKSFVYIELKRDNIKPELSISTYNNPDFKAILKNLSFEDYLKMQGNFVIIFDDNIVSFDIGNKMRIKYKDDKDFIYIWDKYKLVFILLLAISLTVFIFSRYRKLTGRAI